MPKGRVYKTKTKGAQEAHESIRPTSFRRDPDSLAGFLKPEELRLYRLIWQRALASQMEAKELETTTAELEAGPYEPARHRDAGAVRASPASTPRAATRAGTAADDGRRRRGPAAGARARATTTDVRDVTTTQHFTEPPPRFTEASLIKALEEHGIGRPSTYAATISTIVDRGYVRVEERRLHPEPVAGIVVDLLVEHFGDYVDLAFTAKMEEDLDDVASGKRPWVPLLEAFYPPLRDRVDEVRKTTRRRDFTTEATDEVCSLGHPWSSGSGATAGSWPARCTPSTRSRGRCRATSRPPQAGTGETCPKCGLGHARRQARPVRPVRRLRPLPRLRLHPARRPGAAGAAAVRGRSARRTATASSSRVARGAPATSSGAARTTRSATTRRTTSRSGRSTTRTTGRSRSAATASSASSAARRSRCPERRARPSGCACPAARPIRRRSRPRGAAGGAASGGPGAGAPVAPVGGARPGPRAPRRSHAPDRGRRADARRGHRGGHSSRRARLRSGDGSAARPFPARASEPATPPSTRSGRTRRRSAPTSTGSAERGADWRTPARADLRAYLARLVGSGARTSVSQRLAAIRSFHRFAARAGLAAGDPWGSIATPRLPRRLPARPRGRPDRAAARGRSTADERARVAPAGAATRRSGWRSRSATGPSSRSPTRRGCASASSPRRSCPPWTCDAARSACSARAARSASGCSAGRRSPRSRPTSKRLAPRARGAGASDQVRSRTRSS